jgi:hypothetical protein
MMVEWSEKGFRMVQWCKSRARPRAFAYVFSVVDLKGMKGNDKNLPVFANCSTSALTALL